MIWSQKLSIISGPGVPSQGRRVARLGCLGLLRLRLVIAACCDHVAVRSILDLLHSSKQNNYLSPHEAQVVSGRLTWVLSSSYASSGRAATLPLVDRAKKRDSLDMPARNQLSWNRALDFSLEFFVRFFAVLPPLRFDFNISQRRKVIVYSDTSFSIHRASMGIVLLDCESGQRWVCGSEIPSWILRSLEDPETQINQLVLLTILCAVLTVGDSHMRGRDVLFFCDNCSALCAAVHGYARSTDMELLSMPCTWNWRPFRAAPGLSGYLLRRTFRYPKSDARIRS